jgi:hypothetical protein
MYIFFEGISPSDSIWLPLFEALAPIDVLCGFYDVYIWFLFLFCVFMDYVYQKCIYMCLIMIFFMCEQDANLKCD